MGLPLPDGTVIQNRYRILRVLGQGGFGRTYLAQDTNRFDEYCVLKEFDPQTQGSKHAEKAQELFAREAGVLYRLEHSQIPKFRELLRVKSRTNRELLFLVQDYVDGKTYQEILEERRKRRLNFSESEAQQLLEQLLPVLDYIHKSGIVHRDISPDNIILRNSDQKPVLIDFGVVRAAASQAVPQGSQTFVGKPGYAPVEQIKKGKAEPSSDLYALAMTIAVLLTGRDAQSLIDPMSLTCQWKDYASVSPLFAQVLDRMMSNRPSDRYASAQEVLNALSMVSPVPPLVRAPATQPATMAVGRRSKRPMTRVTTGSYPRPWFESLFDAPLAVINGAYWMIKGVFKMALGLVRFTVTGVLKLVLRLVLWGVAIASLIWLVPQILPYVANAIPGIPGINRPSPNSSPSARTPGGAVDYEAECRKLGIDYTEFIGQVNQEFYRKHPDRKNRPLSQDRSDEKLRKEWHTIAQRILNERAKELRSQNWLANFGIAE